MTERKPDCFALHDMQFSHTLDDLTLILKSVRVVVSGRVVLLVENGVMSLETGAPLIMEAIRATTPRSRVEVCMLVVIGFALSGLMVVVAVS